MSDPEPVSPPAPGGSTPDLRLRLLGQMEALDRDGRSVLPRVRKTRALLAMLAMAAGQPVLRTTVSSLLWSTRDREQARGSLRQCVLELNEAVGPGLLIAERSVLRLRDEGVETDLRAVLRATVLQPQALALLARVPLLEDLAGLDPAFDRWRENERGRLAASAAATAEAVLTSLLTAGAPPAIVLASARQLVAIDPLRELGWRSAMSACVAMGERASAMAVFDQCCTRLAELAQLLPSAETRALYDAIRGDPPAMAPPPAATTPPPPPAARGVRLGVMPFRVIGPAEDDGLSLGLADEITTALSRFRSIFLIASPTLAAIRSGPADKRLDGLNLDFVLEGTVQRAGDRIRVTVRLIEIHAGQADSSGEVVWARRFERSNADLFSLQDEVAAETVAQVDPELLLRAAHRTTARPPADPTAYELTLQAIPALYRIEEEAFRAAGVLLEAAIARDPTYSPACAWLAYWHIFLVGQGWAADSAGSMNEAAELANRAIALDPTDARALTIAGHVRAYFDHQLTDAIEMHERALTLNPNLPLAWALCGTAYAYAGRHEDAIRRIEQARRLSPFDPHGFIFETTLMLPRLMLGEFERVVELGRRAVRLNPTLSSSYKCYLSALGHLGPSAEMLSVRSRLLQLEPGFCVRLALSRPPIQREADRALYADGLRRAGLAETSDATPSQGMGALSAFGPGWANP